MIMAEHIHWKKTTNPTYLGSWDFDDGKDMIVTIKDVGLKTIQSQQGTEEKTVMEFEGGVKPLILNTTNMKAISKALGTPYLDGWVGKDIQLYTEMVSAFGSSTMAVRVREFAPKAV